MAVGQALLVLMALSLVSVNIAITPTGAVHVTMIVQLNEGLNEVPLPVPPIVPSIIVNESGQILVPVYQNGTLYIYAPKAGEAIIDYVANVTVQKEILQFTITANYSYKLVISSNVVLLNLLNNVTSVYYHNGNLVVIAYGPQLVQYVLRKVSTVTTRTTSTTTVTTSTVAPSTTSTTSTSTITTTRSTTSVKPTQTTTSITTTQPSATTPTTTTSTITSSYVTTSSVTVTTSPIKASITSSSVTKTRTTPSTTTVSTSTTTVTSRSATVAVPTAVHTTSTVSTATSAITTHVVSSITRVSPVTTSTIRTVHSATRSTRSSSAAPPYLWAGIGAAIAAAVGIGVGLGLRKRGGSGATAALSSELSPLDRDIISIIEQNGGSILQSELQKRLGVPKTTLWRHIRKLEKLGIVKVLKEGGYNKIVLERKL